MVRQMSRKLLPWLGAILGIVLLIIGTQYLASESGEVVVLRSNDAAGGTFETRLWVVENDGALWVRAGNPKSGWLARITALPKVAVVREGKMLLLDALPVPEARDTVNDLMQQKYGFADSYISFFFPRANKIPVRLTPSAPVS
jgi:hypothetical protein